MKTTYWRTVRKMKNGAELSGSNKFTDDKKVKGIQPKTGKEKAIEEARGMLMYTDVRSVVVQECRFEVLTEEVIRRGI